MDRNREVRRAAAMAGTTVPSATRRPRVKDASDDEDRLEEAIMADSRAWERSKKERLPTFHVSASLNPRNKRRRQVLLHESHGLGGRLGATVEDADESVEETEAVASEDDDEPPPPLLPRRSGKERVHSKENENVMDIPSVPRRVRSSMSSSSRFSSISRRQVGQQPADIPQQKSPAANQNLLNGSSSPSFLQKHGRKLKPVGSKVRSVKVPKISEPTTISDQEAEVAEALFVLARSTPSHCTGLLESKAEVKLEAEARTSSPPAGPLPMPSSNNLHQGGNLANGFMTSHVKDVMGPVAEAPKRKRPRVVVKQEEGRLPTPVRLATSSAVSSSASPSVPTQSSGGGEMEVDLPSEKISTDALGLPPDTLKVQMPQDASYSVLPEEKKIAVLEHEGSEKSEKAPKLLMQSVTETGEVEPERLAQGVGATDGLVGHDGNSKGFLISRPAVGLPDDDASVSKLNIDLMSSPVKFSSTEEEAPCSSVEKQNIDDKSSVHLEEPTSNHCTVLEDAARAMDARRGLLKPKEWVDAENSEFKEGTEQQLLHAHVKKEPVASQPGRGGKEGEREREVESPKILSRPLKEETETTVAPSFVSTSLPSSSSSSAPVPLAGWMGGLPQLGYYGPGAAPWAAGAAVPSSNLDVKAAHPAIQLPPPPTILSPVPRMKRCATHVFMAHFIYRDQQVSRHKLWSQAICRAAPYNLNIPPVNMLDNEKLSGHYMDAARKVPTQQSAPTFGYTISQGVGPAMAGSGSTINIGATGTMCTPNQTSGAGVTADAGAASGTGAASGNAMAAHAQYLHAMMQQNGFPSFPFPFNGPPGQAAQFFNGPFFPPHMMPPLPHLQPLAQQAGSVLPVQKQQAGLVPLAHSNSPQHAAPALQQQQLQLQLAPQSPSQSQQHQQQQQRQHNPVGMSGQQFGLHSDKDSIVGNESLSTAESHINAMQRTMTAQSGPNLPNLNVSPSPLMLPNCVPAMSSHEADSSGLGSSGGKQLGKVPHQPFQGQGPTSLPSSMQPQPYTDGSVPGLQMKGFDSTLPQGYSALANRGPGVPGSMGIVSASSMTGTSGHGVLLGSTESSKGHGQQQNYVGHNQQYPRTMNKAPSTSDDTYAAVKLRDYTDDKKLSMKPIGGPQLLPRVDMEVSSASLQGSPTNGNGALNARMTGVAGRTLNSVNNSDVRNSRPTASAGSAQAPLLQTQAQKQAVNRAKTVSGTNVASTPATHSVAGYSDRVVPANLGKFSGTGLPYPGQIAPTSQSSKPSQAATVKVGQRMGPVPSAQLQMPTSAIAKAQVQQARSNQPGVPSTPPRMLPSVSAPVMLTGTVSMSSSHSSAAVKAAVGGATKSPSNGKGSVSVTKAGPPANKKPPVSGPAASLALSPGQSMPVRPVQQKNPVSHMPQFPPQSSISSQQQRLATKNQVYPQLQPQHGQYKQPFQAQSSYRPPLFLPHQPQYMQQSSSQQQPQQAAPQNTQMPVSHHYQTSTQNLAVQHGQAPQQHARSEAQLAHIQQQLQPVSSSQLPSAAANNNNMAMNSPNLTLGAALSGNMSSSASSDGTDQFKGNTSRSNPPKAVYTSVNPLPSGGMPEIIASPHPAVSSQVSSYLQLASVKPSEQKPVPDSASRDDMNNARHLTSTSSSQAVGASNPSSS